MLSAIAAAVLASAPALAQDGAAYGRLGAPLWVWIASVGFAAGALALGGAIAWWFHRKRRRR